MICNNCGKELKDDSTYCGYCGKELEKETCTCQSEQPEAKKRVNGLAIAGFCASFYCPLVGLVLSIIALATSKKRPVCKGFAFAGIACSSVAIILTIIYVVLVITFLVLVLLFGEGGVWVRTFPEIVNDLSITI